MSYDKIIKWRIANGIKDKIALKVFTFPNICKIKNTINKILNTIFNKFNITTYW